MAAAPVVATPEEVPAAATVESVSAPAAVNAPVATPETTTPAATLSNGHYRTTDQIAQMAYFFWQERGCPTVRPTKTGFVQNANSRTRLAIKPPSRLTRSLPSISNELSQSPLGGEIHGKAAEPMASLVVRAGDRPQTSFAMLLRCRS